MALTISEQEISSVIFKHPFTCMLAGPSKSGKTHLLKKILTDHLNLIQPQIQRLVYCFSRWQEGFEQLKLIVPSVEFHKGLPDIDEFSSSTNNLLILDDLMKEAGKDTSIYDIFTVDSHHKNISVFFLTQNLFPKEKNARTISLNCNYIIILNNPRDRAQIYHMARQMFPDSPQFLLEAYTDAVENKPYGYLFLDFTQTTPKRFRVQSGICSGEDRLIYQLK